MTIWIDGRRHVDFDPLLPIECKRLPTPTGDRDEREYVFTKDGTTGGIQRFKAGLHGANHTLGAMIGYVQSETVQHWDARIADWINGLIKAGQIGWIAADLLEFEQENPSKKIATLKSKHAREKGLPDIALRHLWIAMN